MRKYICLNTKKKKETNSISEYCFVQYDNKMESRILLKTSSRIVNPFTFFSNDISTRITVPDLDPLKNIHVTIFF